MHQQGWSTLRYIPVVSSELVYNLPRSSQRPVSDHCRGWPMGATKVLTEKRSC